VRRSGKREGRKVGGPAGQRASARACKSEDAVIYTTAGESRGLEVREGEVEDQGFGDEGRTIRGRRTVIRHHWELEVHRLAVAVAMPIFEWSKTWPRDERYSLVDQARRSSRSVAANIAEAWRKRKYEASFVSKLNDAEGEAAETQDWILFAVRCGYVEREAGKTLHRECDRILGKLTRMGNNPSPWILQKVSPRHEA
jgi:four helix bundle protein